MRVLSILPRVVGDRRKMSKKEVTGRVKLQLPAGKATPAPPVGPVVSPLGINIKQFCDDFNNMTKDRAGFVIPVELTVYKDRSFSLVLKQPPVANLILKAISADKGSSSAGSEKAGALNSEQIDSIVDTKFVDLNTVSKEAARKMVVGTARSMGVEVVDE